MFRDYQRRQLIARGIRNILRRVLLVLTASGMVTVLLFLVAASGVVRADDANQPNLRLFEFTSDFYMPPMGRGRLDGLMASDGSRQRIAIYWIEPAVFRDHTFFLGFSDFIFTHEQVTYWIHGASKPATFDLSDEISDSLLPRDVSVESVALSALAIANRVRSESAQVDTALEVGKFFRQSQEQMDYSYKVPSKQTSSDLTSGSSASDVQILNALPYGRKYSKETQSDGTIVWRAQRVLDGPHVARVTVKPVSNMETVDVSMFDPNSLGQWALVPEPYRAYWSFDRSYLDLRDTLDDGVPSHELYDRIVS